MYSRSFLQTMTHQPRALASKSPYSQSSRVFPQRIKNDWWAVWPSKLSWAELIWDGLLIVFRHAGSQLRYHAGIQRAQE